MVKAKKKKSRANVAAIKESEPLEIVQAPHSFIIHRGLSCPNIVDLTMDFRRIMEPFTAMRLKEKKFNRIKDFVSMSSFFHVSHMVVFNKAATQLSFKVMRMPRGPTFTFKVHQFTLARDVLSMSKRQYMDEDAFKHSPLVIMNNFTGDGKHLKLMATTFQNMFPAINLAQVDMSTIRRCVLFSYTPQTNLVEMRHYSIQVVPVGLSKGVKKLIMGKIPNMSKCQDIADFIMHDGAASESEAEEDLAAQVVLPQTLKRKGNLENNKSAIQLHEIGPRLTLELMKIEEGMLTGEVLYHNTIVRTEEEKEVQRKLIEKKRKLKEQRKKVQAENRARNLKAKDQLKKRKAKGEDDVESEPEDDAEYYEEEVGEAPDAELFKTSESSSRKRPKLPYSLKPKNKKPRMDKKPTMDKNTEKDKKPRKKSFKLKH